MPNQSSRSAIVVLSSLFPSSARPYAGLFVRERMFRVGEELPLCVVSPSPWFPGQSLIRRWRPGFRPRPPRHETQSGVEVWFPRFFSFPGIFKRWDGLLMALGAYFRLRSLQRSGRLGLIDAHFAYPDGYAATLLGRWLRVPVTITLRGTEPRQVQDPVLRRLIREALLAAAGVFSVSDSLRREMEAIGVPADKIKVVGNGVDVRRFQPHPQPEARRELGIPAAARVLVSVGGLVERKGFHRVIEVLPELRRHYPGLLYLIVGGGSAEGDDRPQLEAQVQALGLSSAVRFLGPVEPDRLARVLSAADLFVLATRNEGWANVFLEAMACGLPIVTTDVGGNREVVCDPDLGTVVPFGDAAQLLSALRQGLGRTWNPHLIRMHAEANAWSRRIGMLVNSFQRLTQPPAAPLPSSQDLPMRALSHE